MAEKREGIIQRDMSIIGSYFVCRKWPLAFAKVLMDYCRQIRQRICKQNYFGTSKRHKKKKKMEVARRKKYYLKKFFCKCKKKVVQQFPSRMWNPRSHFFDSINYMHCDLLDCSCIAVSSSSM